MDIKETLNQTDRFAAATGCRITEADNHHAVTVMTVTKDHLNGLLLPTGKIPIEKLGDYIRCRHVIACGVSYLSDPRLIEEGRWDEITDLARRSREIVIRARAERRLLT